ncbi:MAG TPA: hypothetical protein VK891_12470, partial [Euzebyales bacterium]|nr:hypothetical protein [Euzebyales bacterium]
MSHDLRDAGQAFVWLPGRRKDHGQDADLVAELGAGGRARRHGHRDHECGDVFASPEQHRADGARDRREHDVVDRRRMFLRDHTDRAQRDARHREAATWAGRLVQRRPRGVQGDAGQALRDPVGDPTQRAGKVCDGTDPLRCGVERQLPHRRRRRWRTYVGGWREPVGEVCEHGQTA